MTGKFELVSGDENSKARCGILHTAHGSIETPVFMPVGTQASVKSISSSELEDLNCNVILGNTYHLNDRPGPDLIFEQGGLHNFMSWNNVILTDSGGYQVFSLSALNKINDYGVTFKSHSSGRTCFIGPLESMDIQKKLGSDIVMTFDQCPPYPSKKEDVDIAIQRTIRWAKKCRDFKLNKDQLLFGIVQGGAYQDLRSECANEIVKLDFHGYAIGGVSVGESTELIFQGVDDSIQYLPINKPRYLMGVGEMSQMIEAIAKGVDMFDCVMPTRQARNGTVSTRKGRYPVKSAIYRNDDRPLEEGCNCETCKRYSRSYIRHLLNVGEVLGIKLISYHNIHCYLDFMRDINLSIKENRFNEFRTDFHANYNLVLNKHIKMIEE